VLSGRGLCDELITRPEESYRLWCVVVFDLETSLTRRPWPTGGGGGCRATNKQNYVSAYPNHLQGELTYSLLKTTSVYTAVI